MQSKDILIFLGAVALLGGMATAWLPHWSGSLYVVAVLGYFFRGGWKYVVVGGGMMALVWLVGALVWDLPNEGLLSSRVATLFGTSRVGLWTLTALLGFVVGSVGIGLGQALARLLPSRPPTLRRRG
uniref:Uncharacterized protein n=1 Tax=uncultured Bacteroidota bacterium TaxID=152509 RepID=H5SNW7_9BACT|nr:hypothetical protein HGMM_F52E02C36 [uncultured Bacteroidetes bacterium]